MSFPELRQTLVDQVFDTLGEDARWGEDGPYVRVRRASADEDEMMRESSIITRGDRLMVRKSEVAGPVRGVRVFLVDADQVPTGEELMVSGEAKLSRNRVWSMPFVEVEA